MTFSPTVTKVHDEKGNYTKNSSNKKKEKIDHGYTINIVKLLFLKLKIHTKHKYPQFQL